MHKTIRLATSSELSYLRSIGRFAFGRLLPNGYAYPIVRGPLRGYRFVKGAAAGEGGGGTIYFNLAEPEQSQAFIRAVKPGMVLYDIGANVGYYTLLGSRLVGGDGLVLSVEPVIRNICCLRRHLELNGVENVVALPVACSDRIGLAGFSLDGNYATGHLQSREERCERVESAKRMVSTWVSTMTVDVIAQQIGLSPDVMKIDVEGAEFDVLQGAQDTLYQAKPDVFLSVHSTSLRSACLNFLEGMGYSIVPLDGGYWEASEYHASRH